MTHLILLRYAIAIVLSVWLGVVIAEADSELPSTLLLFGSAVVLAAVVILGLMRVFA